MRAAATESPSRGGGRPGGLPPLHPPRRRSSGAAAAVDADGASSLPPTSAPPSRVPSGTQLAAAAGGSPARAASHTASPAHGPTTRSRAGSCCSVGALDHGVPLPIPFTATEADGLDGVVPCCGAGCACVDCCTSRGEDRYRRPQSSKRWAVLLLGIGIIIGPYYSFDNPAGTQAALRGYFDVPEALSPNSTAAEHAAFADFNVRYQLLYSLYSLPNTVLPLFGGALVDALGVRSMTLASAVVALAGHTAVVSGLYYKVSAEGRDSLE